MHLFIAENRVRRIVILGLQFIKIDMINIAAVDNQAVAQNDRFLA